MDKKQFQWIRGDLMGTVEYFGSYQTENGIRYVHFESGRKIAEDKLIDYLAMLENNVQIVDSQMLQNSFYEEASRKMSPNDILFGKNNTKNQEDILGISNKKYANSITVIELLEKQLEKNPHTIEVQIKIPTLKKEFYQMLYEMYPNIKDDLLKLISDKYINKSILKEQIEQNLSVFYGDVILSSVIEMKAEEM